MQAHLLSAAFCTALGLGFAHPALGAEKAQDFGNKAAGGIFELESSNIQHHQGKAKYQAVNDFAQRMITDHRAANAKLQSIAAEQKLQVAGTRTPSTTASSRH